MIIEKKHKPSFHKANARYRGVTEHSQYTNFVLESAHDLLKLAHITTGNSATSIDGHEKELHKNFVSIMTGDEEVGRSNLFTASTLQKIDRTRIVQIPELMNWSPLNGCTMTQSGRISSMSSNGLKDPVGMYSNLYVEPGEKLYIRLKVRSNTGAVDFSFGSVNMRVGPDTNGDTKKVAIEKNQDFITVDYMLRFQYAESVSININVHEQPDMLQPTEIEVKDLEIYYLEESPIQVTSFDEVIKPGLDQLEEDINSIR